jgi:hypothetical protein
MRSRLNPWRRSERAEDITGRIALGGAPAFGGIGHGILGDIGQRHVGIALVLVNGCCYFSFRCSKSEAKHSCGEYVSFAPLTGFQGCSYM